MSFNPRKRKADSSVSSESSYSSVSSESNDHCYSSGINNEPIKSGANKDSSNNSKATELEHNSRHATTDNIRDKDQSEGNTQELTTVEEDESDSAMQRDQKIQKRENEQRRSPRLNQNRDNASHVANSQRENPPKRSPRFNQDGGHAKDFAVVVNGLNEVNRRQSDNENGGHANSAGGLQALWWQSTEPHVPLAAEEDMMKVILRWGAKERGMLRDQPSWRLRDIKKCCHRNRFFLSQACSLRRHHMSRLNPFKSKEQLKLGNDEVIRKGATIFEEAIARFLERSNIAYFSEEEQKQEQKRNAPGQPMRGTPDFKLKEPAMLNVYSIDPRNRTRKRIHARRTIHWVEAKMFYGASTIPQGDKSAVGSIVWKMKKYVKLYGEGAIVFSQGCADKLARELEEIGVTALSCFNPDIDLCEVRRHQRTWCGDARGNILP